MYTLYWNRMKVIMGISACVVAYACESPKSAIDKAAISITENSTESLLLATDIVDTTQEPETSIKAEKIVSLQESNIDLSSEVRTSLHGVVDTTPWWARLIGQVSITVTLIVLVVLLWQTGVGMFIKRIFWSMGLFIPSRAMRSAEVDLKATDEHNPLSFRESVAVRRTSDPAYEYARKQLQKEK